MKTKTLYVSDLDGTLLGPDGYLSETSRSILNAAIEDGARFTIATSRNLTAFLQRTSGLSFPVPVILNTGACLYDCLARRYTHVSSLAPASLFHLQEALQEQGIAGFAYALRKEELWLIHGRLFDPFDQSYLAKRGPLYTTREMTAAQFYEQRETFLPIFYVVYGSEEKILRAQALAASFPDIRGILTHDVYSSNYFLEFAQSSVSKAAAIQRLKASLDVDEIVAFGDNTNDMEMLALADRSYVPANGIDAVKSLATSIIAGSHEDGVARFIQEDFYQMGKTPAPIGGK